MNCGEEELATTIESVIISRFGRLFDDRVTQASLKSA
jgi:hypothetical protein